MPQRQKIGTPLSIFKIRQHMLMPHGNKRSVTSFYSEILEVQQVKGFKFGSRDILVL
jgi:hypothetical protein